MVTVTSPVAVLHEPAEPLTRRALLPMLREHPVTRAEQPHPQNHGQEADQTEGDTPARRRLRQDRTAHERDQAGQEGHPPQTDPPRRLCEPAMLAKNSGPLPALPAGSRRGSAVRVWTVSSETRPRQELSPRKVCSLAEGDRIRDVDHNDRAGGPRGDVFADRAEQSARQRHVPAGSDNQQVGPRAAATRTLAGRPRVTVPSSPRHPARRPAHRPAPPGSRCPST